MRKNKIGDAGFEPATSRSQTVRAKPTAPIPDFNAQGGSRTHTLGKENWILSPARLPVPPPGLTFYYIKNIALKTLR
jgi:hypothetical protein